MTDTPALRSVGLVGIGAMGIEVGLRIVHAGISLLAVDADPERLAEAESQGIPVAARTDALAKCKLVLCLLPDSDVVDQVVGAPGGLLDVLGADAVIVDMGSSDPRRTVALAAAAQLKGLAFVDAPVSGGVRRARIGELTMMFGGDEVLMRRCRPVLDLVASRVITVGPVGSGHAMKALNNLVSATGLTAACEAIEVGRRFGLDPQVMLEVLNVSTGGNNATQTKVGQFVLSETFDSGFGLRLMLKDVALAVSLADAVGVNGGLAHACRQVWQAAAEELPAGADQTEIARMWSESSPRTSAQAPVADAHPRKDGCEQRR